MPDNGWFDSGPIPTALTAQSESGNFFYSLEVELMSAVVPENALAAFKVRSSGPGTIEIFQQPFAFLASVTSASTDARVVYPDFPSLTPTTYDGTISFYIGAATSLDEMQIWDYNRVVRDLNGRSPQEIPIVANREWDLWLNAAHLESTGVKLPRKFLRKAKKVN